MVKVKRKFLRQAKKIEAFEFDPKNVQQSVIANILEELEDGKYFQEKVKVLIF